MLRLPFARITLPDVNPPLKFETGDGLLQFVDVTLGEGERSSTCSIEIADKGLVYANGFFLASYARGGIVVNPLLLQAPSAQFSATPTPLPTPSPSPTPAPTPSPNPSPSPTPAPTTGIKSPTGVPLSSAQDGIKGDTLAREIVAYCLTVGVTSRNHIAYILSTMTGETSNGQFLSEIGGASASYAPWYGRGIVQLTWESNYKKAGDKLGVDFVSGENRELVKQLKYAIPILVLGMRDGWFTGKKLADYGT